MGKRILVVDDERSIIDLVRLYLENEGFEVMDAENCAQAENIINSKTPPDLILLDVMLPDMNGIDFCTQVRKSNTMPIIFLSCKEQEIDKIIALSVGGDDYITKPFFPGELVARVKANLRRTEISGTVEEKDEDVIYEAPGLLVNETVREVYVDGEKISLTAKEFNILQLLIKNPKRIYSADQLFEIVWKEETLDSDRNTIMVYMSNLRRKIENNKNGYKYILNIRGIGYKFDHHLFDAK